MCVGWLDWSEKRFERFVRAFDANLASTDRGDWFYHEPPLYHIIPLLITDDFQKRLHNEVRRHRYGTPELVYFRREFLAAMEGVGIRSRRFDWLAAKARAEEHLALYEEKFPSRKMVTDYEKWILSCYDPKLIKLLQSTAR